MHFEVGILKEIDFGATGVKELLQNVSFILSTQTYSCPMDREFGWTPDLDTPIVAASAINTARILEAIQDNEPRVTVEEIRTEGNLLNGELKPIVRVKINESI